jgi:hypothetical protein
MHGIYTREYSNFSFLSILETESVYAWKCVYAESVYACIHSIIIYIDLYILIRNIGVRMYMDLLLVLCFDVVWNVF